MSLTCRNAKISLLTNTGTDNCVHDPTKHTSRLKPDKVLKVQLLYIRLDKGRTCSAFSMSVEIAICLLIVYRMATF